MTTARTAAVRRYASGRSVDWDERSARLIRDLGRRLRRDLGCVLALGSLFGHAEHRSNFGPGMIRVARIADGVEQRCVEFVSLLHQFGDGPKRYRVRLDEIIGVDVVSPPLE
ncbi:MAG: hypothetical protein ACM3MM_12285 [Acidobacteriota bacterium]